MGRRASLLVIGAVASFCNVRRVTFVPAVHKSQLNDNHLPAAASMVSALGMASMANADAIDDAAKKLSAASYPFLQEVKWNADTFATLPNSNPLQVTKALESMFLMGAAIDPAALKTGALAHSKAISSMDAKGVTTLADYEAINSALGHMIASVPTEKVMDVYNALVPIVDKGVPNYLQSTVNPADAAAAYAAFMEFKDVVKASR